MRLTVVAKTIAGFVVLILMLILTNIISYWGLSDIKQSAQSVISEKMPLQSQVLQVQTEILKMGKASLSDYYLNNVSLLRINQSIYGNLNNEFQNNLSKLSKMPMTGSAKANFKEAKKHTELYLENVNNMYQNRGRYLEQVAGLAQIIETVSFAVDDTSAPLLDLAYLEGAETNDDLKALAGAGNNIDTQLIALLNSAKELAASKSADASEEIKQSMQFSVSNIEESNTFVLRLAESVNTDGLIDDYQSQFANLRELIFGSTGLVTQQSTALDLAALAEQNIMASEASLNRAISSYAALFSEVNESTLAGQSEILDNVEDNIATGLLIMVLGIVIAAVVAFLTAKGISVPIKRIAGSLKIISSGDLTHKADAASHCEFGDLARQVNALSENLHTLVIHILEQQGSLKDATAVSVELNHETLNQVDKQRDQISKTAENTDEVRAKSRTNLEQINRGMTKLNEATQKTDDAKGLVSRGEKQILQQADQAEQSSQVISNLAENSQKIESILDVIKTIAEQTNLLALNAAIEAARAGEQGRGFAVVADEVRTLANRTQNSTEEIEKMIANLQSDAQKAVSTIEEGKKLSDQSVTIINEVNNNVGEITLIIEELAKINMAIVDDTNAQDQLLQSVAERLQTIVCLAEKNAVTTNSANDATEQVQSLMNNLNEAVSEFKV